MARFIYRMQSILNIKTQLEAQAKIEFTAARVRLDEEEARLEALYVRKGDYEEEGRRLRKDKLHVQDILDNKDAILKMDDYIMNQTLRVKRAEGFLEEARIRLQEAIQERKTYERLREKAFEEFLQEENVKELKEIDEITSYRHDKRASEFSKLN